MTIMTTKDDKALDVVTDRDIFTLIAIAQVLRDIQHWEAQSSSRLLAEFTKKLHDAKKALAAPQQEPVAAQLQEAGQARELPKPDIRIDAFGDILPTDGRKFVMGDFYSADQMRAAMAAQAAPSAPKETFDELLNAEHALSASYVRIRQIIGAMNPPSAEPEALYAYVEQRARDVMAAPSVPDFGDYVWVEQKRFCGPNEMYQYKVIGRLQSNAWIDVPAQTHLGAALHDHVEEVLQVICCGVGEDSVERYRLSDVRLATAPSAPAQEKKQ